MSISVSEPSAKTLRFDESTMWVELNDGRILGVPLAYFPRLMKATAQQRQDFIISGGGTGFHWEHLDEDICLKSLLLGAGDQTRKTG